MLGLCLAEFMIGNPNSSVWQGWGVGVNGGDIMNGLTLFLSGLNLMEPDLLLGEQVG